MAELTYKDLKAVLDDNTLDLNMRHIVKIPVKALMKLPRATHLDLSTNLITVIPLEFCTLTHITYLDLSNNNILFLPENIGDLINLSHLDLYKNYIEDLPLSFGKLSNLKWLDLKNNPLKGDLQKVCGDCSDEKACKTAAYEVVRYIRHINDKHQELIEKQNEVNQRIEDGFPLKHDGNSMKATKKRRKKQKKNHSQNIDSEKSQGSEGKVDDGYGEDRAPSSVKVEGALSRSKGTFGRTALMLLMLFFIGVGLFSYILYVNCGRKGRPLIPLSESFCNDLQLLFTEYKVSSSFWKNFRVTLSSAGSECLSRISDGWQAIQGQGFVKDAEEFFYYCYGQLAGASFLLHKHAREAVERGSEVFCSLETNVIYYVEHRSELFNKLRFWWENLK